MTFARSPVILRPSSVARHPWLFIYTFRDVRRLFLVITVLSTFLLGEFLWLCRCRKMLI